VPREPTDPATAIGSSDALMQQKSRYNKVQVSLFDPLEIPAESIDEHNDVDWHDTPEHDELEPETPHDFVEEHTVDGEEAILHGAKRIKSTRSLDLTFLVDDACVLIKIQKIVGIC
jgi:hypothetical protein